MAVEQFADNASTSINQNGGIGAGDATVTVTSATGFPAVAQYRIIIDSEEMIVTAGAGTTTWTITRGDNSTSQTAHANGAVVTHVLTKPALLNAFVTKIDEFVVGAAVATISFPNLITSIPTTFRNLEIIWTARGDNASSGVRINLKFNNDSTAADYDQQEDYTQGAADFPSETLGAIPSVGFTTAASDTANYWGCGRIIIPNYAGTVSNKLAIASAAASNSNLTGKQAYFAGMAKWRTTGTAITSVQLVAAVGNFITGSIFSLYGIP